MITKIQLKNYRSHALTIMELAPFNLLLGPMGAGKTSILHAVSLLLSGQNPLVNAKGEGLRREIREGEAEFHIACKLDKGLLVEQKVNKDKNAIGVNGEFKDVRQQRGRIYGAIGVSDGDLIQTLLDPTPFFTRDEKYQRRTLLQLMSCSELPAPALVQRLGLAESFTSVSQVDVLIKEVKESKVRGLNREIEALQAAIPAAAEFSQAKLTELRQKIATLRTARDSAIKGQATSDEWGRTLAAIEKEIQDAGSALETGNTLQDLLVHEKKNKTGWETEIATLRQNHTKKMADLTARRGEASEAGSLSKTTETTLTVIGGMGKKCGVIDIFDCPLKDADKNQMKKAISQKLIDEQTKSSALASQVEALNKEAKEIEAQGGELNKKIKAADETIADLQRKLDRRAELATRLAAHKAAQPKGGDWQKELESASSHLAAAEIDAKALEDAQGSNSRRAIQVAEVTTKQTQASDLLAAVEELTTLKTKLLEDGSSKFVEIMKGVLSEFGFADVTYSSEPFGFYSEGLLPDQMSGGQRVVFEAALRLAAAKSSGLNIVALDDANKMNESARNKLAKIMGDSGVQVIICSTTESEPKAPKGGFPPNMKVFWCENPSIVGPTNVREVK